MLMGVSPRVPYRSSVQMSLFKYQILGIQELGHELLLWIPQGWSLFCQVSTECSWRGRTARNREKTKHQMCEGGSVLGWSMVHPSHWKLGPLVFSKDPVGLKLSAFSLEIGTQVDSRGKRVLRQMVHKQIGGPLHWTSAWPTTRFEKNCKPWR